MKMSLSTVCAVCVFAVLSGSLLRAEEPKKDPPTPPVKEEPKEPAKAAEADPYKVPTGADSKALVNFCKGLFTHRASVKTREAYQEYLTKMRPSLKSACDQILSLEKVDTTENGRFARRNLIGLGITGLMTSDEAQSKKYIADVKAFLSAEEMTKEDVGITQGIGQTLEHTNPALAKDFYTTAVTQMKKSKDPQVVNYAERLAATVRRLDLLGNTMELKGTTVEGKPFDVVSLKGKVVLVDFWATWCHFCIEELPNVKRNYAGYHNKGFEVVAISGDQERAKLDEFLLAEKLPWIQLHDENGQNAAMAQYAIASFPTTFLIGKDGKVLSLSARGPALDKLLKDQLGEPDAVPAEVKDKTADPAPKTATPKN